MIPDDVMAAGKAAIERYNAAIANGATPRFAEMLAMRQPPGSRTEADAFRGPHRKGVDGQFGAKYAQKLRKAVEADGGTLNEASLYNPTAAEYFGDKRAVYSIGDEEAMVKRTVERRERKQGKLNEHEAKHGAILNPVYVTEKARELITADPKFFRKPKAELHEAAVAACRTEQRGS